MISKLKFMICLLSLSSLMEWLDTFWKESTFWYVAYTESSFFNVFKGRVGGEGFYRHQKKMGSPHKSVFCGQQFVGQTWCVFLSTSHSLYLHNPPFPNSFPSALWASEDPPKSTRPWGAQVLSWGRHVSAFCHPVKSCWPSGPRTLGGLPHPQGGHGRALCVGDAWHSLFLFIYYFWDLTKIIEIS